MSGELAVFRWTFWILARHFTVKCPFFPRDIVLDLARRTFCPARSNPFARHYTNFAGRPDMCSESGEFRVFWPGSRNLARQLQCSIVRRPKIVARLKSFQKCDLTLKWVLLLVLKWVINWLIALFVGILRNTDGPKDRKQRGGGVMFHDHVVKADHFFSIRNLTQCKWKWW